MMRKILFVFAISLSCFFSKCFANENLIPTELLLFTDVPVGIATKTEQKISETPSIVSLVSAQEIKRSGARNLEEVLRLIAGFDAIQFSNYNDANIIVRGVVSNNNKIKFMMNGHSLRSFDGSPVFFLNYIPLESIKRIEIIRGPGSALYGEGAFIGAINIITKDSLESGKTASTAVTGGNFNTWRPTVEYSQDINDFKLYLLADYFRSDGPKLRVESDKATLRFGPRYSAAPGDTSSNFEDCSFQTDLSYKNFSFTGFFLKLTANSPEGYLLALSPDNHLSYLESFGNMGYKQALLASTDLEVKTYYNYGVYSSLYELWPAQTTALFSTMFPATPFPDGVGAYGNPNGKFSFWGSEATITSKISSYLQLVVGGLYEYNRWYDIQHIANYNAVGRPLLLDGITYGSNQYLGGFKDISENGNWSRPGYRNTSACYAQSELNFKELLDIQNVGSLLKMTLGMRYDNYDDIGASTNPRLGLVYAPIEPMTIKLLYGTAFRAPSFRELYNINNPSYVGNPKLKPEKATTLETLIGYKFTNALEATVDYFNTDIRDNIQFVGLSLPYDNVGHIASQGAEMELRYSFDAKKYVFMNATYQKVLNVSHTVIASGSLQYTQEDFNIGNVPEVIANFGANYDVTKNINANINFNYLDQRPRSGEKKFNAANTLVPVDPRDPLPARILANASVILNNFDFFKEAELQLSVYNLLNLDMRDPESSNSLANDIPQAGRTYAVKLSMAF